MAKTRFPDVAAVLTALRPSYPVYCIRPDRLAAAARTFLDGFPGTTMYAVKCNPHPRVLAALYNAGIRDFDTASLPEIASVSELFEDARGYFMHPVKSRAAIHAAYKVYGLRHFAIDHPDEMEKVLKEAGGDILLAVRLWTPAQAGTFFHLADKFGAHPPEAVALLRAIAARGLRAGITFHLGSQCRNPSAYREALAGVGRVVDESGVAIEMLDVGGGFPASYLDDDVPAPEAFFAAIRDGLAALRLPANCQVMCEPGRALVAAGCSLLVQVQLRKDERLYINDGIFGSLSEPAHAGLRYATRLFRNDGSAVRAVSAGEAGGLHDFGLNGPTCDSTDIIRQPFVLPADVREGDWIELDGVGAYSNALATHFNGFHPDTFVEIVDGGGSG